MKNHQIRPLAFLLGMTLLLSAVGCDGSNTQDPETSGESESSMPQTDPILTDAPETEVPETDPVVSLPWESETDTIKIDSFASYTAVIPEAHSEMISYALTELQLALSPFESEGTNEATAVIHVGNTGEAIVDEAKNAIQSRIPQGDWYAIKTMEDGDVVLLGSDNLALMAAARHLIRGYMNVGQEEYFLPAEVILPFKADGVAVSFRENGRKVVFAALTDMTVAPFYLAADGKTDSTNLLRAALSYAKEVGGGTIVLPKGRIVLTDSLAVSSGVTMRGHYADPETQSMDEGTVLCLANDEGFVCSSAVTLSTSSAVQGLTFYYPNQKVDAPFEYEVTVSGASNVYTVRDCNFIGAWKAISSGEIPLTIITIDNVKGTVLHTAIETKQHADVSTINHVKFSPAIWANAGEAFGAPSEEAIRRSLKARDSVGLYVGDCDRDTYIDLTFDGFSTGIKGVKGYRGGSSGSYYGLSILDANIGIEANGIDTRYGWQIIGGRIEGETQALSNQTEGAGGLCMINLCGVEVEGEITKGVKQFTSKNLDAPDLYDAIPPVPAANVFSLADYGADKTGKTDISVVLQQALDDANAAGGGIVYLPAGIYLLEKPVSGGEKTVIQGAYMNALGGTGDFAGTTLLVTHGRDGKAADVAAITLSGAQSGILGMTVYYPENGIRTETTTVAEYAPFVSLSGENTFATYLCLIATSRGIRFEDADGFIADRITGTIYHQTVIAKGSEGGLVSRVHTNGTYHTIPHDDKTILGEDWIENGAQVVAKVIDPYLVPNLIHVTAESCTDLQMIQVFYYGGLYLLSAKNSSVFSLNCEGARTNTESFYLRSKSTLLAYNTNRPNGGDYLKTIGSGNKGKFVFMNLAANRMVVQ